MEEEGVRSANHAFAVGMVVLGLVYLTYVFLWFDFSGVLAQSQPDLWSMTAFYILASASLLVLGALLYVKGEHLISFLLVGVGLIELANGISGWFGHGRWEGAFLVMGVIIIVMAVMVLAQAGYILGLGMLVAAVAYIMDALLVPQADELLALVQGCVYLLATLLFLYLGVAIIVNEEMDAGILPIA